MKPKQIVKVCVDAAMTVGLLFLMGYHLWGDIAHEWVGAGMFILFILHHILNWRWWMGICKGRYTAIRTLQVVIDLLTLAAMVGLMISGVILSSKVFAFLQIRGHMAFARRLHMAASSWGGSPNVGTPWSPLGNVAGNGPKSRQNTARKQTCFPSINISWCAGCRLWSCCVGQAQSSHVPISAVRVCFSEFQ